jgi:hypothetical protein
MMFGAFSSAKTRRTVPEMPSLESVHVEPLLSER